MKKKILMCLVAIFLCFSLTACGEKDNSNTGDNTKNGDYQGNTEGEDSLSNVTDSNYKKIVKNIFGIDIKDQNGWTLKKAESPNKVNNISVDWTISSETDAKAILEEYFNECKSLSKDGVYSQGFNENYTGVVKKDKYDTFAAFIEKELTNFGDYYQVIWIYDNNGKSIQFSMDIDKEKAHISFVLLG